MVQDDANQYSNQEKQAKKMLPQDPTRKNQQQMNWNIDDAVTQNVRELQRLADFYHLRGDYERAQELTAAVETFKRQAEDRERRENRTLSNERDQAG